jgi:hypothetical protein
MSAQSVVRARCAAIAVVAAVSLVGVAAPVQAAGLRLTSCASPHATSKGRLATTPPGAATGAITGHAVTTTFSLAGDDLVAAPPPAGYVPKVSFLQAGCELASAVGVDGTTPASGRLALATLTLRSDVNQELIVDTSVNSKIPPLGTVPTYQNRVAWILVSPTQLDCFSTTTAPATVSPYQVRAIDAATGTSAIVFQDTLPPCNGVSTVPSVTIPYQQVSLAWHLVSRAKDQGHAKVTAAWASCERFTWAGYRHSEDPPNLPSPGQQAHDAKTVAPYQVKMNHRPLWSLTVSVNQPIGRPCGKPKVHVITVFPQELDKLLPKEMRHVPLGALITQQY